MAAYQVVKSHQVERFGDAIDPMSRKTSALLRHFRNEQLNRIGRFFKKFVAFSEYMNFTNRLKSISVKV